MFHRQQGQIAQKSNKAQQKQQSTTYTTAPQVNGAISAKLIQRAKDDPSSLSSDEVLALQETMGNRAVSQLLAQRNAKPLQALTIGEPGDKYEQEADRIASEVVNQINSPVALDQAQTVQREMPEDKDKLKNWGAYNATTRKGLLPGECTAPTSLTWEVWSMKEVTPDQWQDDQQLQTPEPQWYNTLPEGE